jgi:hypothetical protein
MHLNTKMIYLGFEPKVSKKGTSYLLGKFMDIESSSIYEFYIPSDKLQLVTDLGQLQQFAEVGVKLVVTSYNGKADINLDAVQKL